MPIKFEPTYTIIPKIVNSLMRIEAVKQSVLHLHLSATTLNSLQEITRLSIVHYSTMIEGNRLSPEQIKEILVHKGHFPGREREEHEIKGYYAALTPIEQWARSGTKITEKMIRTLHALVMANGKTNVKPSSYRDGQNVILDGRTKAIVYMPPEAKDVKDLMAGLVSWINNNSTLASPIVAGISHYQFATIHPYYDGNGRTARLLTTFILHLRGYDLKGCYLLEEYYARNLSTYYTALNIGESHNYYMGRAEADITPWLEYFIEGMATSFENVLKHMVEAHAQGLPDQHKIIQTLEAQQRRALELFQKAKTITSKQIEQFFGFKPRSSRALCAEWVKNGFLEIADSSNKGRKYRLAKKYRKLIT